MVLGAAALVLTSCKETLLQVVEVATVEISGGSGPVLIGVQRQFTARPRDDRGNELTRRPVIWSSSNPTVAPVDANGNVVGMTAGSATIMATVEGVAGSASIDVHFPAPAITALNPPSGAERGNAFQLTVTGTGFFPTSGVRWNGTARPTTFVNATTLRADIPASDLTQPRHAEVTVVTPAPGGGTSAVRSFTVRINVTSPALALGTDHTCALTGTTAYCWGANGGGEIGDGTTTDRLAPTAVAGNISFVAISSFNNVTCGLDLIGLAYCWGAGANQRGAGGAATTNVPNAVVDGRQYRAISVGASHSCAIDLTGAAWCWGSGFAGALGNGATASQNRPTAVAGGQIFTAIASGQSFSCGVLVSGPTYCWGDNQSGQMGDGTTTGRLTPAPSHSLGIIALAVGTRHACGRTNGGGVYCWGSGFQGQLGNGAFVQTSQPLLVGGLIAATVTASADQSCAVTAAGSVLCWGDNLHGQLGIGSTVDRNAPTQLSGLPAVREIANGDRHSCALTTTAQVYCWGTKGRGQLGDGAVAVRYIPAAVTGGGTFLQVQTGDEFTCGLRTNGRIACWGSGGSGQIGNGAINDASAPADISSAATFTAVITGGSFACGIVSGTRAANCWGNNIAGQLGNGVTAPSAVTPTVVNGPHQWQMLSAGSQHTCGLAATGLVYCWGNNSSGQLGNGTVSSSSSPVQMTGPGGLTYRSVHSGTSHACAAATTGVVYCWGNNGNGQVGDGSLTARTLPVLVSGLTGIVELAGGYFHTCARSGAGLIWCWGSNGVGEIGNGQTSGNVLTPAQVVGGNVYRSLTVGRQVTCAVTPTDQGFCWGLNFEGELGIGSTQVFASSPVAVAPGMAWSSIDSHNVHTCGVIISGAAYCWGYMRLGELGTGQSGIETTPRRVQGGVFSQLRPFS